MVPQFMLLLTRWWCPKSWVIIGGLMVSTSRELLFVCWWFPQVMSYYRWVDGFHKSCELLFVCWCAQVMCYYCFVDGVPSHLDYWCPSHLIYCWGVHGAPKSCEFLLVPPSCDLLLVYFDGAPKSYVHWWCPNPCYDWLVDGVPSHLSYYWWVDGFHKSCELLLVCWWFPQVMCVITGALTVSQVMW